MRGLPSISRSGTGAGQPSRTRPERTSSATSATTWAWSVVAWSLVPGATWTVKCGLSTDTTADVSANASDEASAPAVGRPACSGSFCAAVGVAEARAASIASAATVRRVMVCGSGGMGMTRGDGTTFERKAAP